MKEYSSFHEFVNSLKQNTKEENKFVSYYDIINKMQISDRGFYEIVGQESSGKTTLSLAIVENILQIDKRYNCIYVDCESSLNQQYIKTNLKDTSDRFFVLRNNIIEDISSVIFNCLESKFTNEDKLKVIVIDTVASMISREDFNYDEYDNRYFITQFNFFLKKLLKYNDLLVIFTNHFRENIFFNISAGGNYFHAIIDKQFLIQKQQLRKSKNNQIIGFNTKLTITKIKETYIPTEKEFTFTVYFKHGLFRELCLMKSLEEKNLILKEDGYLVFDNNRFTSKEDILKYLQNENNFRRAVQIFYNS
ncbi:MAG: hypothetical protein N2505_00105 [Endomicrobia bacterium]|nr:hypothetical protein [Endomicrobiia bacterium]